MTLSQIPIGIDVSKAWLEVYDVGSDTGCRIANLGEDIAAFVAALPAHCVVVFEATAPYDLTLRKALAQAGLTNYRVNPAQARAFARACGVLAKTDAVDARLLAAMAKALALRPEGAFDPERQTLLALHRRRDQLVQARAAERTRSADATDAGERESLARHIAWLDGEIATLEADIAALLERPRFARTTALLRSLKGIGKVTAATLLALLPELGTRSPKTIAALAGLAPANRDSGKYRGQRHIRDGRRRVRQALYMAALAAIRSCARFKAFYKAVKQRRGHAKIAIIAVARKLLVTLNAMLRTGQPFRA